MNTRNGLLWAAMLAAACAGTAAQSQSKPTYSDMLARVQRGDMTVDFRAFRVAGSQKSGASSSTQETMERAAFKRIAATGDWAGALESANRALDRNYASPVGQVDAMFACQGLQKSDDAAMHEKILNALLDSIGQSGDGKSPETAYFVVSVQEEYVFLNRILHLRATGQSTARKDGHVYDRLTVPDASTGQAQYIWFNADFDFPK